MSRQRSGVSRVEYCLCACGGVKDKVSVDSEIERRRMWDCMWVPGIVAKPGAP
jgi:hypothetical protein